MPRNTPTHRHPNGTRTAVLYARVSSTEQEHGFSLAAQLRLLREVAAKRGYRITHEFVEAESAKVAGRSEFGQMLAYLTKRPPHDRVIITEKIDRLTRNHGDRALIESLGVTLVLARSNRVVSPQSDPSEWLAVDIETAVATHFSANLSRECAKGMREKARRGWWPTTAPYGYRNIHTADGQKLIELVETHAPYIRMAFELYDTGRYSVATLASHLYDAGMRNGAGKRVGRSHLHAILHRSLYAGRIPWHGEEFTGSHTPIISPALFERVQARFRQRARTKRRRSKHEFAFSGLLTCGHCDRAVTAEIKKERYIYYHCAAPRSECARPHINEQKLVTEFAAMLDRLRFDAAQLDWVAAELQVQTGREREARDVAIRQLEVDRNRLQRRLDVLYDDRLDGRIDSAAYDRRAEETQGQLLALGDAIATHRSGDSDYTADGVALLRLAARAGELFRAQSGFDQRRLLEFVLSNCRWKPGALDVQFRQPFGLIADAVGPAPAKGGDGAAEAASRRRWYTREDSNL